MIFGHTMLRVLDLEKSISFYQKYFQMTLDDKIDFPEGKFSLAFLGYKNQPRILELTYNWDQTTPYSIGDSFGHLAFLTNDIYDLCKQMEQEGVQVLRSPGPMKHGNTVIAFIADPDQNKLELIQKAEQGV